MPSSSTSYAQSWLEVVTIDGPAGVGKTTLALQVATHLGWSCLDTGAMFRTVALRLGSEALTLPAELLEERCRQLHFALDGAGQASKLLCNGQIIGQEIRTEKVAGLASQIATLASVRKFLAFAQRQLGERGQIVTEGRDMGTTIFPTARYKFFLDASPEIRALRRLHDRKGQDCGQTLEELTQAIRQRDQQDRNRTISPLRPAEDACVIETSTLTLEEVFARIIRHISAKKLA